MVFKVVAIAGLVALTGAFGAAAQNSSITGPKEVPPSSYSGAQYVDSRGCVYLRAGIGGRVNWVARVTRSRQPLCGYPPTFAAVKIEVAPDVAPMAKPVPMAKVAPKDTQRTAQKAAAPTRLVAAATPAAKPMNGCPQDAPFGVRRQRTDGRMMLICSRNATFDADAALRKSENARMAVPAKPAAPPRAMAEAKGELRYTCPVSAPEARRFEIRGGGSILLCTAVGGGLDTAVAPGGRRVSVVASSSGEIMVPKGYKAAWNDGRLNPLRGQGTVAGQLAQDQIWTRETPARLVAERAPKSGVVMSTSNAAVKVAPGMTKGKGRYFVQVGVFGEPANIKTSVSRIAGLGLPVAAQRIKQNGKPLQIILAGPFEAADQAKAALIATRRAGFGDAFIR